MPWRFWRGRGSGPGSAQPEDGSPVAVAEAISEAEKVARYRLERFIALGFAVDDAEVLAASDVDLRRAERLLERGCSHHHALLILL